MQITYIVEIFAVFFFIWFLEHFQHVEKMKINYCWQIIFMMLCIYAKYSRNMIYGRESENLLVTHPSSPPPQSQSHKKVFFLRVKKLEIIFH